METRRKRIPQAQRATAFHFLISNRLGRLEPALALAPALVPSPDGPVTISVSSDAISSSSTSSLCSSFPLLFLLLLHCLHSLLLRHSTNEGRTNTSPSGVEVESTLLLLLLLFFFFFFRERSPNSPATTNTHKTEEGQQSAKP